MCVKWKEVSIRLQYYYVADSISEDNLWGPYFKEMMHKNKRREIENNRLKSASCYKLSQIRRLELSRLKRLLEQTKDGGS